MDYFGKTPREILLAGEIARLKAELAYYKHSWREPEGSVFVEPETVPMYRIPDHITVPVRASVGGTYSQNDLAYHVVGKFQMPQGPEIRLSYLVTDNVWRGMSVANATSVLAMLHERFVKSLADFLSKES